MVYYRPHPKDGGRLCFDTCLSFCLSTGGGGVGQQGGRGGSGPAAGGRGGPAGGEGWVRSSCWGGGVVSRGGGVGQPRGGGVGQWGGGVGQPWGGGEGWVSGGRGVSHGGRGGQVQAGGMPLAFTQEDFLVYFQIDLGMNNFAHIRQEKF